MASRQDYDGFSRNSKNALCSLFRKLQLRKASAHYLYQDYVLIRNQLLLLQNDGVDPSIPSKLDGIIYLLRRYIEDAPQHKKNSIEHIEEVYKFFLFLHDCVTRHIKVYKHYPLTHDLLSLLTIYVELEYKVLYYEKNYTAEYQKQVENRILSFLLTILYDPTTNKKKSLAKGLMKPNPVDNCAINALYIIKSVNSEYKRNHDLIENLMSKLLQKLNVLDHFKAIKKEGDESRIEKLMQVPKLQQISRYLRDFSLLLDDAESSEEELVDFDVRSPSNEVNEDIKVDKSDLVCYELPSKQEEIDLVDCNSKPTQRRVDKLDNTNVESRSNISVKDTFGLKSTSSCRDRIICVSDSDDDSSDGDVEYVPHVVVSATIIDVDDLIVEKVKSFRKNFLPSIKVDPAEEGESDKCLESPDTSYSNIQAPDKGEVEISPVEPVNTTIDKDQNIRDIEENPLIPNTQIEETIDLINTEICSSSEQRNDDNDQVVEVEVTHTDSSDLLFSENQNVSEATEIPAQLIDNELHIEESLEVEVNEQESRSSCKNYKHLLVDEATKNIIEQLDKAIEDHDSQLSANHTANIVQKQGELVPYADHESHEEEEVENIHVTKSYEEIQDLSAEHISEREEETNVTEQNDQTSDPPCEITNQTSKSADVVEDKNLSNTHTTVTKQDEQISAPLSETTNETSKSAEVAGKENLSNNEMTVTVQDDQILDQPSEIINETSKSAEVAGKENLSNTQATVAEQDEKILPQPSEITNETSESAEVAGKENLSNTQMTVAEQDEQILPQPSVITNETCENAEVAGKANLSNTQTTVTEQDKQILSQPCEIINEASERVDVAEDKNSCSLQTQFEENLDSVSDHEERGEEQSKETEDSGVHSNKILEITVKEAQLEGTDVSKEDVETLSDSQCFTNEIQISTTPHEDIKNSLDIQETNKELHTESVDVCIQNHIETEEIEIESNNKCGNNEISIIIDESVLPSLSDDENLIIDEESEVCTQNFDVVNNVPAVDDTAENTSSDTPEHIAHNVLTDSAEQIDDSAQCVTQGAIDYTTQTVLADSPEHIDHTHQCVTSDAPVHADHALQSDALDSPALTHRDVQENVDRHFQNLEYHSQTTNILPELNSNSVCVQEVIEHSESYQEQKRYYYDTDHPTENTVGESACVDMKIETEIPPHDHEEIIETGDEIVRTEDHYHDDTILQYGEDTIVTESCQIEQGESSNYLCTTPLPDVTVSDASSAQAHLELHSSDFTPHTENIEQPNHTADYTDQIQTVHCETIPIEPVVNSSEAQFSYPQQPSLSMQYNNEPLDYIHEETVITDTCEVVNDLDVLALVAATKEKIESIPLKSTNIKEKQKPGRKPKGAKKKQDLLPTRVTRNSTIAKFNIKDNKCRVTRNSAKARFNIEDKCIPSTFMNLENLVTPPPICVYNMISNANTDTEESLDEPFNSILIKNIAFDEDTIDDGIVFVCQKKIEKETLLIIPESVKDHSDSIMFQCQKESEKEILISIPESVKDHPGIDYDILNQTEEFVSTNLSLSTSEELCKELKLTMTKNVEISLSTSTECTLRTELSRNDEILTIKAKDKKCKITPVMPLKKRKNYGKKCISAIDSVVEESVVTIEPPPAEVKSVVAKELIEEKVEESYEDQALEEEKPDNKRVLTKAALKCFHVPSIPYVHLLKLPLATDQNNEDCKKPERSRSQEGNRQHEKTDHRSLSESKCIELKEAKQLKERRSTIDCRLELEQPVLPTKNEKTSKVVKRRLSARLVNDADKQEINKSKSDSVLSRLRSRPHEKPLTEKRTKNRLRTRSKSVYASHENLNTIEAKTDQLNDVIVEIPSENREIITEQETELKQTISNEEQVIFNIEEGNLKDLEPNEDGNVEKPNEIVKIVELKAESQIDQSNQLDNQIQAKEVKAKKNRKQKKNKENDISPQNNIVVSVEKGELAELKEKFKEDQSQEIAKDLPTSKKPKSKKEAKTQKVTELDKLKPDGEINEIISSEVNAKEIKLKEANVNRDRKCRSRETKKTDAKDTEIVEKKGKPKSTNEQLRGSSVKPEDSKTKAKPKKDIIINLEKKGLNSKQKEKAGKTKNVINLKTNNKRSGDVHINDGELKAKRPKTESRHVPTTLRKKKIEPESANKGDTNKKETSDNKMKFKELNVKIEKMKTVDKRKRKQTEIKQNDGSKTSNGDTKTKSNHKPRRQKSKQRKVEKTRLKQSIKTENVVSLEIKTDEPKKSDEVEKHKVSKISKHEKKAENQLILHVANVPESDTIEQTKNIVSEENQTEKETTTISTDTEILQIEQDIVPGKLSEASNGVSADITSHSASGLPNLVEEDVIRDEDASLNVTAQEAENDVDSVHKEIEKEAVEIPNPAGVNSSRIELTTLCTENTGESHLPEDLIESSVDSVSETRSTSGTKDVVPDSYQRTSLLYHSGENKKLKKTKSIGKKCEQLIGDLNIKTSKTSEGKTEVQYFEAIVFKDSMSKKENLAIHDDKVSTLKSLDFKIERLLGTLDVETSKKATELKYLDTLQQTSENKEERTSKQLKKDLSELKFADLRKKLNKKIKSSNKRLKNKTDLKETVEAKKNQQKDVDLTVKPCKKKSSKLPQVLVTTTLEVEKVPAVLEIQISPKESETSTLEIHELPQNLELSTLEPAKDLESAIPQVSEIEKPSQTLEESTSEIEPASHDLKTPTLEIEKAPQDLNASPLEIEQAARDMTFEKVPQELTAPTMEVEQVSQILEASMLEVEKAPQHLEASTLEVEKGFQELGIEKAPHNCETSELDTEKATHDIKTSALEIEKVPQDLKASTLEIEQATRDMEFEKVPQELKTPTMEVKQVSQTLEASTLEIEKVPQHLETSTLEVENGPQELGIEKAPHTFETSELDTEKATQDIKTSTLEIEKVPQDLNASTLEIEQATRDMDFQKVPQELKAPTMEVEQVSQTLEASTLEVEKAPQHLEASTLEVEKESQELEIEKAPHRFETSEFDAEKAIQDFKTSTLEIEKAHQDLNASTLEIEQSTRDMEFEKVPQELKAPTVEVEQVSQTLEASTLEVVKAPQHLEASTLEVEKGSQELGIEKAPHNFETSELDTEKATQDFKTSTLKIEKAHQDLNAPTLEIEQETRDMEFEKEPQELKAPTVEVEQVSQTLEASTLEIEKEPQDLEIEKELQDLEIEKSQSLEALTLNVERTPQELEIKKATRGLETSTLETEKMNEDLEIEKSSQGLEASTLEVDKALPKVEKVPRDLETTLEVQKVPEELEIEKAPQDLGSMENKIAENAKVEINKVEPSIKVPTLRSHESKCLKVVVRNLRIPVKKTETRRKSSSITDQNKSKMVKECTNQEVATLEKVDNGTLTTPSLEIDREIVVITSESTLPLDKDQGSSGDLSVTNDESEISCGVVANDNVSLPKINQEIENEVATVNERDVTTKEGSISPDIHLKTDEKTDTHNVMLEKDLNANETIGERKYDFQNNQEKSPEIREQTVEPELVETISKDIIPSVNKEVCSIMKDWENFEDSSDCQTSKDSSSEHLLNEIVNDFDIAVEHEESIIAHIDGQDENSTDILETCSEIPKIYNLQAHNIKISQNKAEIKSNDSKKSDDDEVELVSVNTIPDDDDDSYDSEPDIDRLFQKYSKKKHSYLPPQNLVSTVKPDHAKLAAPVNKRVRFSLERNTVKTIESYESPTKRPRLNLKFKDIKKIDYEQSYKKFLTQTGISGPSIEPVEETTAQHDKTKTKEIKHCEPPKKKDPKRIDFIIENLKNKNLKKAQIETETSENSANSVNIQESPVPHNVDKPQEVEEFFPDITLNQVYDAKPSKVDNIFPYIQEGTKNNCLLQIVPSENEIEIESSVQLLDVTKQTTATCEITDNLIAVMFSEQNRPSKTGFIFFKGSDHNYHNMGDPLLGGECDTNESDHSADKEIISPELENVLVSDTILPYLTDNHLNQESSEDSGADFQLLELIDNTLARESSPPLTQTINCDNLYHTNLKQVELEFNDSSSSNNIEFSKVSNEVFVNQFQQQTMSVENMSELMNVVLTSIQNLNNMTKMPNPSDAESKEMFLSPDLDFNVDVIEQTQPQNLDFCDFSQSQESNCESIISTSNSITDYPNFHYLPITYESTPISDNHSNKKVIVEHIPQYIEEPPKEIPQFEPPIPKPPEEKPSPRDKAKLHLLNLPKQKTVPPKKQLNSVGFVRSSSKTKPSAPKPKKLSEPKIKEPEGTEPKPSPVPETLTVNETPPNPTNELPKEKSLPIIDDIIEKKETRKQTSTEIVPNPAPPKPEDEVKVQKSPAPSKSPRTPKQSDCDLTNISVQFDMIDNVKRRKRKPVDYSSIEKLLESDDYDYRKVQKNKGKKDEKLKVKQKEEDLNKQKSKNKPALANVQGSTSSTTQNLTSKKSIFEDSNCDVPKKKRSKPEPRLEPEAMNALFDKLVKEGNINSLSKAGVASKETVKPPIFSLDSNSQKKLETTPVKQIGVVNPIPRQSNNVRKEPPNRNSYGSEESRTSSQYYPYYERSRRSYPYSSRESSRSGHPGSGRRPEYPTHSNDQRYSSQRSSSGSSRSSRSSRHHSTSRSSAEQRNYWYGSTTDLSWREDMKKKFPHMFKDEVYF